MRRQISKQQRHAFYRWWRRRTKFKYELALKHRQDDHWILDGVSMWEWSPQWPLFKRWLDETGQKLKLEKR